MNRSSWRGGRGREGEKKITAGQGCLQFRIGHPSPVKRRNGTEILEIEFQQQVCLSKPCKSAVYGCMDGWMDGWDGMGSGEERRAAVTVSNVVLEIEMLWPFIAGMGTRPVAATYAISTSHDHGESILHSLWSAVGGLVHTMENQVYSPHAHRSFWNTLHCPRFVGSFISCTMYGAIHPSRLQDPSIQQMFLASTGSHSLPMSTNGPRPPPPST